MHEWILSFDVRIIYPYDLIYGYKEKNIFRDIVQSCNLFQRLFCSPSSRISKILNVGKFQKRLFLKSTSELFKNIDYLYIPEGSVSLKLQKNSIIELIFNTTKYINKTVIAYPISVFTKLRDIPKNNQQLDLLMTISDESKRECEDANLLSLNVGGQRFKESWLRDLSMYFSKVKSSNSILEKKITSRVVLVLTKNNTGLVSEFFTLSQVRSYRRKYLKRLSEMGFFIIVKPHPGNKHISLLEGLKHVPIDRFEISELPVAYLASISDFSVAEFPTNSIFDVISCKKNVYWPFEFLTKIDKLNISNLSNRMIEKGFPEVFFSLIEFGLPEKVSSSFRGLNINKVIDTHVEMKEIFSNMESVKNEKNISSNTY